RMILATAMAVFLAACMPSFTITSPVDGSLQSQQVTVTIDGEPKMSGLAVKVDGVDYSNQINWLSDSESSGVLRRQQGKRIITAEADVNCWYCSSQTYHPSSSRTVCVGPDQNQNTKIAHSKSDDKNWVKINDTTIGVAVDDNTPKFRWNTWGGIGSSGLITSTENPCLCMHSTDQRAGIPIALAVCDPNDSSQVWQMVASTLPAAVGYWAFQNVGFSGCLAEGPNNTLIQSDCDT